MMPQAIARRQMSARPVGWGCQLAPLVILVPRLAGGYLVDMVDRDEGPLYPALPGASQRQRGRIRCCRAVSSSGVPLSQPMRWCRSRRMGPALDPNPAQRIVGREPMAVLGGRSGMWPGIVPNGASIVKSGCPRLRRLPLWFGEDIDVRKVVRTE